jgi:hypothetical protein
VEGFEFRLSSTRESSAKYGPCEVCGQWVSEVYIQTTFRVRAASAAEQEALAEITGKEPGSELRMHHSSGFGHEACLIACRSRHDDASEEHQGAPEETTCTS